MVFFAESAEKTNLTQDEVAAINLYTIECDFYKIFNQTLRERDRKKLLPFFPYLKHLLLGLNKLPNYNGKLWRGVKLNLKVSYPEGKKFFWWSFSSCTVSLKVLESEQFCGKTGNRTIFCISSQKGKDIKMFSNYADEGEVVLMPGYFVVKGVMEPVEGLSIIDLEELPSPFDIFIGIPKTTIKIASTVLMPTQRESTPTTQTVPKVQKSVGVVKNNLQFKFTFGSADGQFKVLRGVAIDFNGNIVVADKGDHQIQVVGSDGQFIQKFGSKGSGDGQFDKPQGVAIDSNGNIVVVDSYNHRIQIFGPDGRFIWKFGSKGSGDGQFEQPMGVAIDFNGNIVVADYLNHRIQMFGPDGKFKWKVGKYGSSDGKFQRPRGVAFDSKGNIFVVEHFSHRIQIFGTDGEFIWKFGKKGSGDGKFSFPVDVAIDANGCVIVTDRSNNRIQKFESNGQFICKFGTRGSKNGQFNHPMGVAIDSNGNIVVTDSGNHRIQMLVD